MDYKGEHIKFVESSKVTDGVVCEVYKFIKSDDKDLGKVFVSAGYKTPLQKVLKGEKTIESYESGKGKLIVISNEGLKTEYSFPGKLESVEVKVGEIMQWEAEEDLIFNEVCWPQYEEGRFENQ